MPRQFEFQPSRLLAAGLAVAHGGAIAMLPLLALPLWWALVLASLLLLSLLHFLRRDALLNLPSSWVGLTQEDDGRILLLRRDGVRVPCRILRDSLITPFLTVLNVRIEGDYLARGMVILPDRMEREPFRRLRVWLKLGDQAP